MNWSPSPWFLAEVNHILAACLLVIVATWRWKSPRVIYLTGGLILLVAGLKEFWADLSWLEHDALAGSMADFTFYVVGVAGGLVTNRWFWWGVLFVVTAIAVLTGWDIFSPLTEPQ